MAYKGYRYLIEAARYLTDDYVVLIGGSGPLMCELQAEIETRGVEDKVRLLGRIPDGELPAYYGACDVFCLSSVQKTEAFGIVQIEAMVVRQARGVRRHPPFGRLVGEQARRLGAERAAEGREGAGRGSHGRCRRRAGIRRVRRRSGEALPRDLHTGKDDRQRIRDLYQTMERTKIIPSEMMKDLEDGLCNRSVMSPAACRTKRVLDVMASVIGMAVFSPLFLIIYIAIKWEDGGKAIFRQERVGYHGETFTLYKFRSMIASSESDGRPALCSGADDRRLTRVGRFLREHHLDELPQLWNVLKGEMSFVGPRPERRFFVDKIMYINPAYALLYQLRPGLFSAATLYNGYTDTMEKMLERLRMDLDYLYNRTLWLDTKIIFLTVFSILTGKKF